MHVVAPKEAPTCRSQDSKGEWFERAYGYVIACHSLRGNFLQMKVVEDVALRRHKAVSFVVERDKDIQEWNEQKLPNVVRKKH